MSSVCAYSVYRTPAVPVYFVCDFQRAADNTSKTATTTKDMSTVPPGRIYISTVLTLPMLSTHCRNVFKANSWKWLPVSRRPLVLTQYVRRKLNSIEMHVPYICAKLLEQKKPLTWSSHGAHNFQDDLFFFNHKRSQTNKCKLSDSYSRCLPKRSAGCWRAKSATARWHCILYTGSLHEETRSIADELRFG